MTVCIMFALHEKKKGHGTYPIVVSVIVSSSNNNDIADLCCCCCCYCCLVAPHAQVDTHGVVSLEGRGSIRSPNGVRYTTTSVVVADPAAADQVLRALLFVFVF